MDLKLRRDWIKKRVFFFLHSSPCQAGNTKKLLANDVFALILFENFDTIIVYVLWV